jgi:hypothetical protein
MEGPVMRKKLAVGLALGVLLTGCVGDLIRGPNESGINALSPPQRALMEKALAGVAPSRTERSEFFFVGVAGWASEDVFLNEARAAADLFRRRFGADGHIMLLANNPRTATTLPLASVSNLRVALAEVATKMGAEDILFLYVTSHGRRAKISLRNGAMNLRDLGAGALRRMLDSAGIKNRVLALSACYSGSFIDALRSDNTLIMTAAASDRVSFGCGHDGTFTYFGQALIGEALEKEGSFYRAFATAVRSIENRELVNGFKPSRPQFFMGKAIGPVLNRIERRLRRRR